MLPVHLSITRRPLHRRALDVLVFLREDGLFDVEARHIDAPRTVAAASLNARRMPHPAPRSEHGDADARPVGMHLMQGARQSVQQGWRVTRGCNDLTQRCQVLPMAFIQARAGSVSESHEGSADDQSPFQLDRCHARRPNNSLTVAKLYPRWRLATPASTSTVS